MTKGGLLSHNVLPTQRAPSKSILCTLPTQYATMEHIVYLSYTICYSDSVGWVHMSFHLSSEGAKYAPVE